MKNRLLIALLLILVSKTSFGQGNQFIAEIKIFAGNYAPQGWAKCEGQLLPISQNTALFSLLGTTYGGNGTSNFALPDLRERVAMCPGQGQGLTLRDLGETGGSTAVSILPENLPAHTHTASVSVSSAAGTSTTPTTGSALGTASDTFNMVTRPISKYNTSTNNILLLNHTTSVSGGNIPLNIEQPYLVCNYIIALQCIYPPRP